MRIGCTASKARVETAPFLLMLGELPSLSDAAPALPSILLALWDHLWAATRLKPVPSGSHVTPMRRLEAADQPLHGRRTRRLVLAPLDVGDLDAFVPPSAPEAQLRTYAVVGGLPGHLILLGPGLDLAGSAATLLLDPAGNMGLVRPLAGTRHDSEQRCRELSGHRAPGPLPYPLLPTPMSVDPLDVPATPAPATPHAALIADPAAHGYPRPQLERDGWTSLNGPWQFALDRDGRWRRPESVQWDGTTITVPFAPETPAGGVGETGFFQAAWYRRAFAAPALGPGERLLLHFGAVDYEATVWVNRSRLGSHEGGYLPFTVDVTDALLGNGPADGLLQELVVLAQDDPHDVAKPRGKQDWQLNPHSIWYPRTTGIWQTVWLEVVPATHVGGLRWSASLERWEIGIDLTIAGARREGLRARVKLSVGGTTIADDTYQVIAGEVHRRIALSDPGIDDYRNELLWSPGRPTLIEAEIELWAGRGERVDAVRSYTALRQVGTQGDQFMLNGRPYPLRMVLDQGYWEHTGLTAPSDAALRLDVELAKAMGFNGVRKHQKIEDPRYLYWADRLGLLVWGEMPSAYRFTTQSVQRLTRQWPDAIARDISHPCVVAWVPFNESWGVPDLPTMPEQRHCVQALYHLTRTLDPSRPVIGNDGWESVATDIVAIHDYDHKPERIAKRYQSDDDLPRILAKERPGGRRLVVAGHTEHSHLPVMLTEFGGMAYHPDPQRTWGYSRCQTVDDLLARYRALLDAVHGVPLFAGFCYTQFTDTYQEANGLLTMSREPKIPLEAIYAATRGELGSDPGAVPGVESAGPGAPLSGVLHGAA